MIRFFRNIRQKLLFNDKFSKYLIYAIGEIILLVIGILIALQINNWNEDRKNDHKEALLIKNIIKDLRLDADHMNKALNEVNQQLDIVDSLIAKAIDSSKKLDYKYMGVVRYSSDFRLTTQRNHAQAVSDLENESIRELLQNYFLEEDLVLVIFLEYETIIINEVRPYLRESGMHNLNALYAPRDSMRIEMLLQPEILDAELKKVEFQQLLFERRLKTESFKRYLVGLKMKNRELIQILNAANDQ